MQKLKEITSGVENSILKIRLIAFDFDGVFTDNMVFTFEDGREAVRCCRSDGLGLQTLKFHGIDMVVISTEENTVVTARCKKLNISCIQGCKDKLSVLQEVIRKKGISPDETAYVGNDVNDLPCLKYVGLPIIVHDAHPDLARFCRYRTNTAGGNGAVREICDLFDKVIRKNR
jgi:3-deoxy-D-manno-octulosonate 8-phosphate phosphatase (KDO 8-P phosphatase)